MTRLTASAARVLAGPTVDEYVDEALVVIEKAARAKLRYVDLHGDFWVNGGYSRSGDWEKACKILTDLGYKVWFFYEELQFVNMYTKVEW